MACMPFYNILIVIMIVELCNINKFMTMDLLFSQEKAMSLTLKCNEIWLVHRHATNSVTFT